MRQWRNNLKLNEGVNVNVVHKTERWQCRKRTDSTVTINTRGETIYTMRASTIYWMWKIPVWMKFRFVDGSREELYRYLESCKEKGETWES